MIGLGGVTDRLGASRYLAHSTRQASGNRWFWRCVRVDNTAGILANSFGWIYHRDGRQPWAVFGEMRRRCTIAGRSRMAGHHVLVVFAVLYVSSPPSRCAS